MATQHERWELTDTTGNRSAQYAVTISETGSGDYNVTIEYGRIGSAMQTRRKEHSVPLGVAQSAANELVNRKLQGNYVLRSRIRGSGKPAPSPTPAASPPDPAAPPARPRATINPINWASAPIVF